jgi:hypothetical protein
MELLLTWTIIKANNSGLISYGVFSGPHDKHSAWYEAVDMCGKDATVVAIVPGSHTPHSEFDAEHTRWMESEHTD